MPTAEEIARANKLVRWRANPEKIRVSICKLITRWRVTVTCRATGESVVCRSVIPERAIMKALKLAEKRGFDGTDLGMGWAYEHPWR